MYRLMLSVGGGGGGDSGGATGNYTASVQYY